MALYPDVPFPSRFPKLLQKHSYSVAAGCLILLAMALRVILVVGGWTATDADEAMMDLAALHIARKGELPVFFYGQHYLGVLEAYLGSVTVWLFGPSVLAMRLEMLLFTAGFLLCLFILTSKLYSKAYALVILALFVFGSSWTMAHQIQATGYPELPFFVALIFLLSYILASSHTQLSLQKRIALYMLWGILVGLVLWCDILVAPYILVSGLLLVMFCWHDLWRWAVWLVLAGLILGAAPLIYYNLTAPAGQDSLHVFLHQLQGDPNPHVKYHILASVLYSLPLSLGYSSSCISTQWAVRGLFFGPDRFTCIVSTGLWGGSYLLLLLVAVLLSVLALKKLAQHPELIDRHAQIIKQTARFLLLAGFIVSFFTYMRGGGVSIDPIQNWRYLICGWLSIPAILWPLWTCDTWFRGERLRVCLLVAKASLLLLLIMTLFYNDINVFQYGLPAAQVRNQQLATLEQTLEQMHITRFYSEYWTCNVIIVETHEQLICGDTFNELEHGTDRYITYREMVRSDPHPGFVYPSGSAQIVTLEHYLTRYRLRYDRFSVDGYVIYRMYGHIPTLDL